MDDEETILNSKQSILYNEGDQWVKKGGNNFDVAQGSYDGAECAELVELFILDEIRNLDKLDPGI